MASQSNGLCIQLEEYHTNKYPMATPEQMHGKKQVQRLHRKWNTQGWHPSGNMFRVASNNASVHFQLDVKFVHHVSTVPRSHLPYLSCFLQRFDFGSVNFLPAIPCSCSVMPRSVIFCYVLFAGPTPSATWKLCPCLCLPPSVCLCLSASVHTIQSKRIDSIGLSGNSHWTALSAPHHRPINRPTEIRVSRKYANRPKVNSSVEPPCAYSITQCEFSHNPIHTPATPTE